MAVTKYKNPITGEWEIAANFPATIFASDTPPTDPNIKTWLDTSELGLTPASIEAHNTDNTSHSDIRALLPNVLLNVDIAPESGWSITEYFRYSKYGKLVIVDIGGLSHSTGTGLLCTVNLPIFRSRPVVCAINDLTPSSGIACFYGGKDTTCLYAHITSSARVYGQLVYITD